MLKSFLKPFAIIALITSSAVQALPIVEADAFVTGDNKAIYDSSSRLRWLDYGITNNKSFEQVTSELDSTYLGWRLPTDAEVVALANKVFGFGWIGDDDGGDYNEIETTRVADLMAIFGYHYSDPTGYSAASLYLSDNGGVKALNLFASEYGSYSAIYEFDETYYSREVLLGDTAPWWGTLLVKETSVAEPSAILLMGLGLFGLGMSRRKTAK